MNSKKMKMNSKSEWEKAQSSEISLNCLQHIDDDFDEIDAQLSMAGQDLSESWKFLSSSDAIAPIVMVSIWIALIAAILI